MNDTTYFEKVYAIVRQIPYGRVTSYGSIAACLGMRSGARMVGWAMNNAHHQKEYVPAHRVVNRNGVLTGKHHFDTPGLMKQLLENEGLVIINDQIQNFNDHFWDPLTELTNKA
ncbi:MAG: MGMT family protein [Bacteroidales bacterium]|nr:MGMT family protein [Bacteroidales bacterium]MCF8326770.1 MGMT family protein [Bacteroidales bacterium]